MAADTQTVLTYLDAYCERAGEAGLWAEPLNAATNLFFILAALVSARALWKVRAGFRADLWALVVFLFAIGVGSGLWHMFASHHTMLMDVLPITLFINLYLISALRRLLGLSWGKTLLAWGAYFGLGMLAQVSLPPDLLNGTIMYIPTFLTLALLTVAVARVQPAMGHVFVRVLLVWCLSLTFRTVDREICEMFPYGTHFLWHTLNAWVLWRLLGVLIGRARYTQAY